MIVLALHLLSTALTVAQKARPLTLSRVAEKSLCRHLENCSTKIGRNLCVAGYPACLNSSHTATSVILLFAASEETNHAPDQPVLKVRLPSLNQPSLELRSAGHSFTKYTRCWGQSAERFDKPQRDIRIRRRNVFDLALRLKRAGMDFWLIENTLRREAQATITRRRARAGSPAASDAAKTRRSKGIFWTPIRGLDPTPIDARSSANFDCAILRCGPRPRLRS